MKNSFEELFLTLVKDGGTVTVGDKTFNVTLAEAAKESEKVPVGEVGKWYRYVGTDNPSFTKYKWYKCEFTGLIVCFTSDNSKKVPLSIIKKEEIDLANPCPFDPQTLVGKTVKFDNKDTFFTVVSIFQNGTKYFYEPSGWRFDLVVDLCQEIEKGTAKVIEPEPEMLVSESVEFVRAGGRVFLKKDNYFLCDDLGGFLFGTAPQGVNITPLRPKLIPCHAKDISTGEWIWLLEKGLGKRAEDYLLKTADGWVGFERTDEFFSSHPLHLSKNIDPLTPVHKVQF